MIVDLPNLKSINQGWYALRGRSDPCSELIMKDLPNLESINSEGDCFNRPRIVTLSNIPNLSMVNLVYSFEFVETKSIHSIV